MKREQIWQVDLGSVADTERLGRALATALRAGDYLLLKGDLGTGKTTLARAIIHALGGAGEEVPSPSFTLVQSYTDLRVPVWHFDLYRVENEDELPELGFEEAEETGACLVEWPAILSASLPPDYLEIELEDLQGQRSARLRARGNWAGRLARLCELDNFLRDAGWQQAERRWLQGDASSRSYEKLILGDRRAVLMNAPKPAAAPPLREGRSYGQLAHLAQDMTPFVAVSAYLQRLGLSAPKILASDLENGFLLLEDLGDDVYTARLARGADMDAPYRAAIEALNILHSAPVPQKLPLGDGREYELPVYDQQAFEIEVELLTDWYWPFVTGTPIPETVKNEYLTGWRACLGKLSNQRTLVLRDYHSPNLLWLAGRKGARRAGLIDFQDAVIGPPAYDLVSLLQDARVDVPPEREAVLFRLYAERAGFDAKTKQILQTDMALMGAQRAAKILGIFVRLARRDGKPGYLKHLPRVGAALARNLAHPALAPIQGWFARYLPQILAAPPARKPRVTSAMILAAGLGTRMRHLTANTPKPLVRVDGKALIDHVLERTRRAGIDHIVVNLHYRADQLQRHLEAKHLPHLAFSHERTALLDTGGGVRKALPKLGAGAFFILNTDSLWLEGQESNLARMGKMWSADDMDFLLLLAPARGSLGYDGPGDFHLAQDGRLRRRGPDETAEFAHTGICITHPGAFANSPSGAFSLNLLWDRALAGGRLFGLPLSGEWMHVGTPESVEQATRRLREKSG